jgi:hypothetical protein
VTNIHGDYPVRSDAIAPFHAIRDHRPDKGHWSCGDKRLSNLDRWRFFAKALVSLPEIDLETQSVFQKSTVAGDFVFVHGLLTSGGVAFVDILPEVRGAGFSKV